MSERPIPIFIQYCNRQRRTFCGSWPALCFVIIALGAGVCPGQTTRNESHQASELQQQYDAAQRAQTAGDMTVAAEHYQSFLAGTLQKLAEGHAHIGDYPGAAKLFEKALAVEPAGSSDKVRLAYAQAALVSRDMPKAKSLAETMLVENPKNAEAHLVLGEALLETDSNKDAQKQLEEAVALDSNYKNGLALATADLALDDTKDAGLLFAEMSKGFGDQAAIHVDFGRAYAEAGYPDLAIAEFEKALAKDPKFPEAHYCLGASYLLSQGETGFAKATAEFNRELSLNHDDYFSLSQLGYIALTQHNFIEAETYLKRAASLDPSNPDNPLLLGQVYIQLHEPAQAEQAFRQAIALTVDLSRNHYQVQRAHYLLGRLLVQTGHLDEAKQQMQISGDLLKQNMLRDQARLKGAPISEAPSISPLQHPPEPVPVDAKAKQGLDSFTTQVAPALADSYNNLGAIAASGNDFAIATGYFEEAASWSPALDGLDYNWGRAAFSANFYAQAVPPLKRYLTTHPQDQGMRRILGISLFMTNNYRDVVDTLRPLEPQLAATPQVAYMYARSLVLTGDYDYGVARLRNLSKTNPSIGEIHRTLGEAYAGHGDYQHAADELRAAIQLNAADDEAKSQLALALVHLEKKGTGIQP
jgi:tetratricopeptide (TPR) repeat protein